MRYIFKSETMETERQMLPHSSHIREICKDFRLESSALAFGQLKQLFGEPLYMSRNLENQYDYCISATDENNEVVYLTAYSAGSGPAIGGESDVKSKEAADALVEYISQAKAADYKYEGYYMDGPCIVRFGVINGVPYAEEENLEQFSEEEIKVLFQEL